jgi:hypothetical protein
VAPHLPVIGGPVIVGRGRAGTYVRVTIHGFSASWRLHGFNKAHARKFLHHLIRIPGTKHAPGATLAARQVEKVFFFEKKKQKTFVRCRGLLTGARKEAKVFCFFFSKKKAFLAFSKGPPSMPSRILALFNLRPGIETAEYEHWAKTVDLPTVNALPSIEKFEVFRVTGKLGSADPAPYAYAELIDIKDMEIFGKDVATDKMQSVAAEFGRLAETVFLTTEKLG